MRFIFGDRLLDTERRELRRGADLVAVEPQVFDLLVHLLVNCDRVVRKDDLVASIWHGRIVSDSTVTSRINAARKAIGDNGDVQKLIRTIPRKGFRFVGEICTPKSSGKPVAPSIDQARHSKLALPLPDRPAIAVLPFTNMTGDPQQDYFSDGISEDIITALSKLRWFFVIARNSSFTYKGKNVHLSQIAEELGVGYVVEGSVRKDGDRVRITAQLNDAVTGRHIWAERYDRNLADVFAVQDEITDAIVAAIEPQLYAAENFRAQRKPPDSMDAWDLVMRALSHYWRITRQDCLVAQALLEKAIAIDPNYGQALGVLATSHTFSAHMGWEDMAAAMRIAESAAHAAIRADSEDPWAHYALGCVYLFTRRFDDSRAEFELALQLNPNFSAAQAYYGLVLCNCGRIEEAELGPRRALRLSPRDPLAAVYVQMSAYIQYVQRNYKRRCGSRAKVSVNAPISSRLTDCLQPPRAWLEKMTSPRLHCGNFVACNPMFRSNGSQHKSRSGTPIASTFWKVFAAPDWINLSASVRFNAGGKFPERNAPCQTRANARCRTSETRN